MKDVLLINLVNNIEPVECSYETALDQLEAEPNTFTIDVNERWLSFLQKFQHSRIPDPLYKFEDTNGIFRTFLVGTFVESISIARDLLLRIIRTFDESGLNSFAAEGSTPKGPNNKGHSHKGHIIRAKIIRAKNFKSQK